jgi:hypothetical protein
MLASWNQALHVDDGFDLPVPAQLKHMMTRLKLNNASLEWEKKRGNKAKRKKKMVHPHTHSPQASSSLRRRGSPRIAVSRWPASLVRPRIGW